MFWRLPPVPRILTGVMLALTALAAAIDTGDYYALVSRGMIDTTRACPASLAVLVLALVGLRELKLRTDRVCRWKLELLGAGFGALTACLAILLAFGATDYRRSADCAIVLGAAVRAGGAPSLALSDRVAEGVRLYHEGHVQSIVMTGGVDPVHGLSEPRTMKRLAVEAGVPADDILLDEGGFNTRASAVNCARIMQGRDWENALLVSHGYHLLRAKTAFSRAGATVYTVPATETRMMRKAPYYVLRECVAWIYYALPLT